MKRLRIENGHELSDDERRAVEALARLAKRWPKALGLYSMAGTLSVMREPIRETDVGGVDPVSVVWSVPRGQIPNDGGDW